MSETPIRLHASENDAEKMLRLCAEDPMWAAHAEVSKSLLVRAADELAALRKDAERYRKWKSDYTGEGASDMLLELADAWESAQVDAAIDAALAVGAA